MSWLERWREWRGSDRENESVAEEMSFHVEQEIERNMRYGMDEAQARRAALRSFGGIDRYRERARDERTGSAFADFGGDVRYSLRSMARAPAFTVVAVLTLALGIGANSGIFSVLNGVILRPLPYPAPDALVRVYSGFMGPGMEKFWLSGPEFFELKERMQSFAAVGAYQLGMASVGADEMPVRVSSAAVTHDVFAVLAVAPQLGRTFDEPEAIGQGERAAVLSHGLWRRAFAGDPAVVGRTIPVNGIETTIIGVMPPGYDIADAGIEIFLPALLDPASPGHPASHNRNVIARLRPDVSLQQAEAELAVVLASWAERNPEMHVPTPGDHPVFMVALHEDVVGDVRPALLLLLGAVGFVLLIACANVANLLLARAELRQREIAVRTALGARGWRLVRQFLTEGVVLALIGGAVGLLLGYAGVQLLIATNPESIPRADAVGLDARVVLFTALISIGTGILFGLAPALHVSSHAARGTLRDGALRTTAGMAKQRLRRVLVVAELALAVMLVVGSTLLLRSFAELQRVDPGFDPDGLLTFQVAIPAATYPGAAAAAAFTERLLDRLSTLPGVTSATAMSGLPPQRSITAQSVHLEGSTADPQVVPHNIDFYQNVAHDYFATMRIPLRAGRIFERTDDIGAPVVVVNERFAERFYSGVDPVGRRLRSVAPDAPWFTIVGVVADVKQAGLEAPAGSEAYFLAPQLVHVEGWAPRSLNFVLRTAGDPALHAAAVQAVVRELDPAMPIANLATMNDVLHAALARPRFITLLLGIFGAVSLALAAIGTYGVMTYTVAQRRQEIGIRMALGARAGGVLGMVLRQGLALALAGIVIGLVAARALTSLLGSLLYNVAATDVTTFIVAPAVLAVAALLACWVPAHRATRVDPATVLKDG